MVAPETLEADLLAGDRRGMQIEVGQYRPGVACAAVVVVPDRDMERRVVLGCSMPAAELMASARVVRAKLLATARSLADVLEADTA
jgi:DNA-binding IclR family transcriptional regulator